MHRLEEIKVCNTYENKFLKNYICGYAIIISNAHKMWIEYKNKEPNDINFHIADKTYTKTDCTWRDGINFSPNYDGKNSDEKKISRIGFEVSKSYKCDWSDENDLYFTDEDGKSPAFRYLVIKVD